MSSSLRQESFVIIDSSLRDQRSLKPPRKSDPETHTPWSWCRLRDRFNVNSDYAMWNVILGPYIQWDECVCIGFLFRTTPIFEYTRTLNLARRLVIHMHSRQGGCWLTEKKKRLERCGDCGVDMAREVDSDI